MMRITFQRTGGFMGQKVDLILDLGNLPAEQAEILRNHLDEANFLSLEDSPPASHPSRDAFYYTITVETEILQHTIRVTDLSMPAPLRPLVEELSRIARLKHSR